MQMDVASLVHLALPTSVAAAAAFGVWRCLRILRIARDLRVSKLLWFYALFTASLVAVILWTARLHADPASHASTHGINHESMGEQVDIFLLAHHLLMLASLGVGVAAFGHPRRPAASAALAFPFLAPTIPVLLGLEAALALYIATQAILNHLERRSRGSLQVAAGFLLFFLGHLSYFLLHQAGAARSPLGDIFSLVGIVVLVQLLPRLRR